MARFAVAVVGLGFVLACSGGGGGMPVGDVYTPECCDLGGFFDAGTGQPDCEAAGGTWVSDPGCEVVCCADAEGHGYMAKAACAASGGTEEDAATVCGE